MSERRVASTQLEAPMAMPRNGHQWACILTCPGHHKNDKDDEDDENDENCNKMHTLRSELPRRHNFIATLKLLLNIILRYTCSTLSTITNHESPPSPP